MADALSQRRKLANLALKELKSAFSTHCNASTRMFLAMIECGKRLRRDPLPPNMANSTIDNAYTTHTFHTMIVEMGH